MNSSRFFVPKLQDLILSEPGALKELIEKAASSPVLFQAISPLLTHHLLTLVVRGEKNAAEAMLQQASLFKDKTLLEALLSSKDTVASYSFGLDRNNPVKVKGTALQIALIADDVDVIIDGEKVVDGIAEMILPYFKKLTDGEELIAAQLQVDPAEEKKEQERSARDLEALEKVLKALETVTNAEAEAALAHDAKEDNPAEAALIEFRNALEPKEVVTFGRKQFNPALLLRALELYDEKFAAFGNTWDAPKNKLFVRKIIGYIDRFLSACTGQVFAFGGFYVIEMREKLIRNLKFRSDNAVIFPLDSDPRSRLGYDFMAGRGARYDGTARRAAGSDAVVLFKTYVEQKQRARDIMQRPSNPTKSSCLIS